MAVIKSTNELRKVLSIHRSRNEKIGLVHGIFDIVHYGHIDMLRFAKSHVDRLVVGIDSDETARLTKGTDRPIFYQHIRAQVLSELRSTDYVCTFDSILDYHTGDVDYIYDRIVEVLKPDALITNSLTDRYWENKKRRAERFGCTFIPQQSVVFMGSTSRIIDFVEKRI